MTEKRQIQNRKEYKLDKVCFEISQQFGLGVLNEEGVEDFLSCQAKDGLEGNSESASGFASQNLYTSRSNKENVYLKTPTNKKMEKKKKEKKILNICELKRPVATKSSIFKVLAVQYIHTYLNISTHNDIATCSFVMEK